MSRSRWHIERFLNRVKPWLAVHQPRCVPCGLGVAGRKTGRCSPRACVRRSPLYPPPCPRLACFLLPHSARIACSAHRCWPPCAWMCSPCATRCARQPTSAHPVVSPDLEVAHLLGRVCFFPHGGVLNRSAHPASVRAYLRNALMCFVFEDIPPSQQPLQWGC